MAEVTENYPPDSTPPEPREPREVAHEEEQPAPESAEDPGYLTETGEVAGEDGSVVPIIGGLPAVEGSAWDIGAPADERGAALAEHEASQERQAGQEDAR
jgi:hypothetical protein